MKMPSRSQFSRVDTLELKAQIYKKLGRQRAEKYFHNLKRLLNLKVNRLDFEKFCYEAFGKENLALHNRFIKSILTNACLSHGPPSKQTTTGHSQNTKASNGHLGSMVVPLSPQKGRSVNSRDRRLTDRMSPLGPQGKVTSGNVQEATNGRGRQSAPELISIGSKALLEVGSVEDGEEVEQVRGSPGIQSRSPVTAPLGLNYGSVTRKALHNGLSTAFGLPKPTIPENCSRSCELPDTRTLRKRLESKLEKEGLGSSVECANLLNHALDTYLKRLIEPCINLARSRGSNTGNFNPVMNSMRYEEPARRFSQGLSTSLLDFQVAMNMNPQLLGGNWPLHLEKICSYTNN